MYKITLFAEKCLRKYLRIEKKMQKIFIVSLLLCGCCYHSIKNTVHNMPVVGSVTHSSFSLASDIYEGTQNLVDVPYEFVKNTIASLGIEAYIYTLPLKKEVVTRLVARLRNPKYSGKLLAFVLFLKNQYTSQNNIQKFSQYAQQHEFHKIIGSAPTTTDTHTYTLVVVVVVVVPPRLSEVQ